MADEVLGPLAASTWAAGIPCGGTSFVCGADRRTEFAFGAPSGEETRVFAASSRTAARWCSDWLASLVGIEPEVASAALARRGDKDEVREPLDARTPSRNLDIARAERSQPGIGARCVASIRGATAQSPEEAASQPTPHFREQLAQCVEWIGIGRAELPGPDVCAAREQWGMLPRIRRWRCTNRHDRSCFGGGKRAESLRRRIAQGRDARSDATQRSPVGDDRLRNPGR